MRGHRERKYSSWLTVCDEDSEEGGCACDPSEGGCGQRRWGVGVVASREAIATLEGCSAAHLEDNAAAVRVN